MYHLLVKSTLMFKKIVFKSLIISIFPHYITHKDSAKRNNFVILPNISDVLK